MNITRKRYRRLWAIFVIAFMATVSVGNLGIVSYDIGEPMIDLYTIKDITNESAETLIENSLLPDRRQGHPRAPLFTNLKPEKN